MLGLAATAVVLGLVAWLIVYLIGKLLIAGAIVGVGSFLISVAALIGLLVGAIYFINSYYNNRRY